MPGGERDDQLAMKVHKRTRRHDQPAIRDLRKCSHSVLDFIAFAAVDRAHLYSE